MPSIYINILIDRLNKLCPAMLYFNKSKCLNDMNFNLRIIIITLATLLTTPVLTQETQSSSFEGTLNILQSQTQS